MPAPPDRSDHWRRFRQLMIIVAAVAVITITGAFAYLRHAGVAMPLHFVIALALGIGLTMLLTGALMGLLFVSSRSGHDVSIDRDRERRSTRH